MSPRRRRLLVAASALLLAPRLPQAQDAKVAKIGVLTFAPTPARFTDAFRLGLRDHGYVEGKNIVVEWRSAESRHDKARLLAQELVRLKVDVIVATPTQAVAAAKNATRTIPIVMAPVGDPVGAGFVASLAHPGGNITGLTPNSAELGAKLVEIVRELKPNATRIAVLLGDSANPFTQFFFKHVQAAAAKLAIRAEQVLVLEGEGYDAAFEGMARERVAAVVVEPLYATRQVARLAIKHRLPAITTGINAGAFPEAGGLLSYGANPAEIYRHAATYVDKILKGARPADLPVEQPTKFEMVINVRTAKAIGITVPQSIVVRVDRVIQ
jgi:ABC-type uncharacterized transport system substrate-binding protein